MNIGVPAVLQIHQACSHLWPSHVLFSLPDTLFVQVPHLFPVSALLLLFYDHLILNYAGPLFWHCLLFSAFLISLHHLLPSDKVYAWNFWFWTLTVLLKSSFRAMWMVFLELCITATSWSKMLASWLQRAVSLVYHPSAQHTVSFQQISVE